jgi:hypothetical protein
MVDPESLVPPYTLVKGGGIPIDLKIRNTGHEPARDIHGVQQTGLHQLSNKVFAPYDLHLPNLDCKPFKPYPGVMTVFPGTTHELSGPPMQIAGADIAGSVLGETGIFFVNECITYSTFGRTHHTSACFYLHMSVLTHKPEWAECATGNTAD